MPYCTRCGEKIEGSTRYCTNCGICIVQDSGLENVHISQSLTYKAEEYGYKKQSLLSSFRDKKIILLTVVLISLLSWQVVGSIIFNQKMYQNYKNKSTAIERKMGTLFQSEGFTLVQLIEGLKNIQRENRELSLEVDEFINRYKTILFKNTGLVNEVKSRDERLEKLLSCSEGLISAIQRNEQVDKDIDFMISSPTASWERTYERCNSLIKENEAVKTEVVKMVAPEEIKKYQDTFIEALTEKSLFLSCFNDFLNSALNALVNYDMSVEYYRKAYSLWELEESYNYATEAVEYADRAEQQAAEGRMHWEKYKKLKKKIKAEGEII